MQRLASSTACLPHGLYFIHCCYSLQGKQRTTRHISPQRLLTWKPVRYHSSAQVCSTAYLSAVTQLAQQHMSIDDNAASPPELEVLAQAQGRGGA